VCSADVKVFTISNTLYCKYGKCDMLGILIYKRVLVIVKIVAKAEIAYGKESGDSNPSPYPLHVR
jgi:hypothetical protein